MASTFLKGDVIATTALGILQREIVLPQLIRHWTPTQFIGAKNDTVQIPIRATLVAREFALRATGGARTITADDLTESSTPVTLSKVAYSAVFVTDEQLTLDIKSFADQVLSPQVTAVAMKLETYAYAALADETQYLDGVNLVKWQARNGTPVGAYTELVHLRRILNEANVPQGGRKVVVGPAAEELILTDPQFLPTPQSEGFGSDPSAMSEAKIGRIAGFDIYVSNLLAATDMFVLTPDSHVLANIAPVVPDGVTYGKSLASNGYALRWIRDYDPTVTNDRSVVSTFSGTAAIKDGVVPVGYTAPTGAASALVTPGSETKVAGNAYNARAIKVVVKTS